MDEREGHLRFTRAVADAVHDGGGGAVSGEPFLLAIADFTARDADLKRVWQSMGSPQQNTWFDWVDYVAAHFAKRGHEVAASRSDDDDGGATAPVLTSAGV